MAQILRMPAVAANSDRAVLLNWSIGENAGFTANEVLAEVETEKAVVEIEAESDGVLIKRLVSAGSEVEVGAPIAVLGRNGEGDVDITALLGELGMIAGSSTTGAADSVALPDEPTAHAAAAVGETADPIASIDTATDTDPGSPADGNGTRIFASPLARQMANEAGITLAELTGSGPGGRIRRDDVRAAITARTSSAAQPESRRAAPPAGPAVAPPDTIPVPVPGDTGNWVDEPHSRLRALIAKRLTESKNTVPHFYLRASARVDRLLALRAELNTGQSVKISVNDLVIAAAARAYAAVPAMNCSWTEAALRRFNAVDISVAVASAKGLVTPTLRAVDTLTVTGIASRTKDLVAKADAGRLRPEDLEGGAMAISNLGMFGVEDFAAIINPPQSAILAVGAARQEAVVTDGRVEVGTILRMTLSVDHRALDGALAAKWLAELVTLLENPLRVLA